MTGSLIRDGQGSRIAVEIQSLTPFLAVLRRARFVGPRAPVLFPVADSCWGQQRVRWPHLLFYAPLAQAPVVELPRALFLSVVRDPVEEPWLVRQSASVFSPPQEAHGMGLELGDLDRGTSPGIHAVNVEGSAFLTEIVEALFVEREDR